MLGMKSWATIRVAAMLRAHRGGFARHVAAATILSVALGCSGKASVSGDPCGLAAASRSRTQADVQSVDELWDHIIAVDGQGRPCDPTLPNGKEIDINCFRQQLAHIFRAMHKYHQTHSDRKVLIFVHGSLNKFSDSLERGQG